MRRLRKWAVDRQTAHLRANLRDRRRTLFLDAGKTEDEWRAWEANPTFEALPNPTHQIVSVTREVKAVPEVDTEALRAGRAGWTRSGPYPTKDVEREVSVIVCSCGEEGFSYMDENVSFVHEAHRMREEA